MIPNVYDILGVPVSLHDSIVGLAMIVAALVLWRESTRQGIVEERWWWAVLGALTGAAIGARLGTWFQHLDPAQNLSLVDQWTSGNRSILSALVGAWIGVVIAKRLTGWQVTTGDAFAPAVALGMAVGRIGCFLTEVPGRPTGGSWGITLGHDASAWLPGAPIGVSLHPSFAYEIAFQLAAFAYLWRARLRPHQPGALLRRYVVAYALFRFAVEFVRGNEEAWFGCTRPQWAILGVAILVLAARLVIAIRRRRRVKPSGPAQAAVASGHVDG